MEVDVEVLWDRLDGCSWDQGNTLAINLNHVNVLVTFHDILWLAIELVIFHEKSLILFSYIFLDATLLEFGIVKSLLSTTIAIVVPITFPIRSFNYITNWRYIYISTYSFLFYTNTLEFFSLRVIKIFFNTFIKLFF